MSDIKQLLADLTSGDDELAERAIPQLVALDEEAVRYLLELSKAGSEDIRWWSLCALAHMEKVNPAWFIPGLQDSSAAVRESAAMALCTNPHKSVVPQLINSLDDPDGMVATLAANALIGIGKDAVPELISVFENGSPSARPEAARALAEIRDPRVIPVFMKSLDNESLVTRHWAEQGLENLGVGMVYFAPD
jgi:HEAT repeat protein